MVKGNKKWRKEINTEEYKEKLVDHFDKQQQEQAMKKLPDADLFKISLKKEGLTKKREQLKKDRFKKKGLTTESTSLNEVKRVERLAKHLQKMGNENKPTPTTNKEEVFDLWGGKNKTIDAFPSRKRQRQMKVLKKLDDVPACAPPLAGQSYNPKDEDYKTLIKEVVEDELKEIKENTLFSLPEDVKSALSHRNMSYEEDVFEEEVEGDQVKSVNKPVDRLKKKLRSDRLRQTIARNQEEARKEEKAKAKLLQEADGVKALIKQDIKSNKTIEENLKKLEDLRQKGKELLKKGIVKKPRRLGRHLYNPRKVDFQTSSERSSNLRRIQPVASLMHDRYDSIFKRSLLEPPLTVSQMRRKREKYRKKFKPMTERGEAARKIQKKLKKQIEARTNKIGGDADYVKL